MAITPDTKDWTWVLSEPCPECGFDPARLDPHDVPELVRQSVPRWQLALGRGDAAERPDDSTWSVVEYACHVRDVFTVFAERIALVLREDDPEFANWDQDATALERDYASQDASVVAAEIAVAGERAAAAFAIVPDDAWDRTARRSNGSRFTAATLAQYFWHDVEHHLHDVRADQ
jgi:hypothetical protein